MGRAGPSRIAICSSRSLSKSLGRSYASTSAQKTSSNERASSTLPASEAPHNYISPRLRTKNALLALRSDILPRVLDSTHEGRHAILEEDWEARFNAALSRLENEPGRMSVACTSRFGNQLGFISALTRCALASPCL